MKGPLGDRQRLLHISESIQSIQHFLSNVNRYEFDDNYMLQLAVTKLLENIGEAANGISKELRDEFKSVDWAIMIRSRNVYVHQYFALDLNIIWETVQTDLPPLKNEIDAILKQRF